jgi:hypothetical protein
MNCRCGRPTRDEAQVCDSCIRRLRRNLGDIPYYADQLDVTLTRQSRLASYRVGSRSAERPLPFDWLASVTVGTLHNTLTSWARTISVRQPPVRIADLCLYLEERVGSWARISPEGPQMVDEVSYLLRELKTRIDRPPDWYVGPCSMPRVVLQPALTEAGRVTLAIVDERICQATLWTRLDAKIIICRECKARFPAAERREWLVAQVEDSLVPLNLIVDALPTLIGVTVARDTARKWVSRTRLVPRGLSMDGDELFRGGDVMELARMSRRRSA